MATPTDQNREKAREWTQRIRHGEQTGLSDDVLSEGLAHSYADEREVSDGAGYDRGRRDGRDHWSKMYAATMENIRAIAYRTGQLDMFEEVRRHGVVKEVLDVLAKMIPIEPPPQESK